MQLDDVFGQGSDFFLAVLLELFDVVLVVDCTDECLECQNFAFDPVADMDEGVFLGAGHLLQVLFQITAGPVLQQSHVTHFAFLRLLGILEVLVGLQERVELMVKHDLLLLHGHELLEEVLEHDQLLMLRLLFNNELVDLSREINNVLLAPVLVTRY